MEIQENRLSGLVIFFFFFFFFGGGEGWANNEGMKDFNYYQIHFQLSQS